MDTRSVKGFFLASALLASAIIITAYLLLQLLFPEYYFQLFFLVPVFIFGIVNLVHRFLIRASDLQPARFLSRYIGAMGVKLLIYIVFLLVILLADREHALPFLIIFLFSYLVFTIFEVVSILNYLKNKKNNSPIT